MATYKINYHLTQCQKTSVSSETYANDTATLARFCAKAEDGCYFLPNDGEHNYISRHKNGIVEVTKFTETKVSPSNDNSVIAGEMDGITSDGKYFSHRMLFGGSNTGEMECYLSARGGSPVVKTLNIANNVTGTTASYVKNGENFDITLKGNEDGTFTETPLVKYRNAYNELATGQMSVNGNIATFSVPVETNENVTIDGTFTPAPKELTITNNITNTQATATKSDTGYIVDVTGTASGSFMGVPPTVTYNGKTENMSLTGGHNATITVPIETESVIINGKYVLDDYVPVTYDLTNCSINGSEIAQMKTGTSHTFDILANEHAKLTKVYAKFYKYNGDVAVVDGVLSASNEEKGSVTVTLPTGATELTVFGNADVVQPSTITNYGAINVYVVTLKNLDDFSKKRFFKVTGETDTGAKYKEVNLGDYVNRIKRIFTSVPIGGDDVLKCGNYNTNIPVKTPESDVITLDFGDVELTGVNGNNEDYNAQIQLFIPCRGIVSVDNKYIGKTVNLTVKVNVITGDSVALLSCDGVIFQTERFSLSRDVIYKTGTNLAVIGGEEWDEQILYGLEPYVLITENLTVNVPVNNTQENVTLQDVTGFARFENVNLNPSNLLVDEYNDIINSLEAGVYL